MLGINQPSRIEPPHSDKRSLNYKLSSHDYVPMKKNTIRQILNFPKKLRYSMKMDAVHPEDETRSFILEYNLSDGKIQIKECVKPNSGRKGGTFLSSRQIKKPGSSTERPEYYGPEDFFIGTRINAFNHYFIITGADLFVYRHIEANAEKFSENLKNNMKNYFLQLGLLENSNKIVEKLEKGENLDVESFAKETEKSAYEMENCLKTSENAAQSQRDPENVFLKPSIQLSDKNQKLNHSQEEEKEEIINSDDTHKIEKNDYLSSRELRWSDQIEAEQKYPLVSDQKEYLENDIIHEPTYSLDRNKKFELGQLNYEQATEPLKSKFPAPQQNFLKTSNFNNTPLVRETYKAPKVS